jgi:segregation and condensation protein B
MDAENAGFEVEILRRLPLIEALIFTAEVPISEKELIQILFQIDHQPSENQNTSTDQLTFNPAIIVSGAIKKLKEKYNHPESGVELREVAGGWALYSRPDLAPTLRLALSLKENRRLSRAALETLSVIAYKQPITKAEIEYIRGVNSDSAIYKLLERELIESAGRADLPGRPMLYKTSENFLIQFKLRSLDQLPRLSELTEINKNSESEDQQIIPFINPDVQLPLSPEESLRPD